MSSPKKTPAVERFYEAQGDVCARAIKLLLREPTGSGGRSEGHAVAASTSEREEASQNR